MFEYLFTLIGPIPTLISLFVVLLAVLSPVFWHFIQDFKINTLPRLKQMHQRNLRRLRGTLPCHPNWVAKGSSSVLVPISDC
jgi:hypothetical protein